MRKIKSTFLFLIPALFLIGCYESEVPLSETPSLKVDNRLIGSWISIPGDSNEKTIELLLHKFNENEYLAAWKEGDYDEVVLARGFTTRIKNINIINLQGIESIEANKRTFIFIKYGFNDQGNLITNLISDDYPGLKGNKFKTSEAFNKFVGNNISQEGFFSKIIEFKTANEISFSFSHARNNTDKKQDIITKEQAAILASKIANEKFEKDFGVSPFSPESYTAELVGNKWHWGKISPAGINGCSAKVTFNKDGSDEKVKVAFHTDIMDIRGSESQKAPMRIEDLQPD